MSNFDEYIDIDQEQYNDEQFDEDIYSRSKSEDISMNQKVKKSPIINLNKMDDFRSGN